MTRTWRAVPAAMVVFGVTALTGGPPIILAAEKVPQPPPSVNVLGNSLVLKSSVASATEDLVAEYIPAKETLDRWTLMLGVRIFKARLTPDEAVAMKSGEVEARRAQGDYTWSTT